MRGVDLSAVEAVASRVGVQLAAQNYVVAVAESCTGGLVAYALTARSGSSAYFNGGSVVYANAAKSAVLGVPAELIEAHGAVSKAVALAMAKGVCKLFQVDVSVSTTGIAGPTGGSEEKPVGLVWIAVCWRNGRERVSSYCFEGNREAVRFAAGKKALEMLYEELCDFKQTTVE